MAEGSGSRGWSRAVEGEREARPTTDRRPTARALSQALAPPAASCAACSARPRAPEPRIQGTHGRPHGLSVLPAGVGATSERLATEAAAAAAR